jgi:hypothetical protein
MNKTLTSILGTAIGLATLTALATQPAEAAKLTWKVTFFDELGAAFGGGNFITDTEPQTLSVLEHTPTGYTSGTYTTTNVVTAFDLQVGPITWSSTEPTFGVSEARWIADNGQMGRVYYSGYPTNFVSFGGWGFVDRGGKHNPISNKGLRMDGVFQPGQINTWYMSYLEFPMERWGEWYANPENYGKPVPRHERSGTWVFNPVVSTPEPGIAGAGLMMLGLWGMRQRSRRLQPAKVRAIDS